ncbi:MAG TPA: RsmD family RNA methyltransferase, partial [Vicinamibacterales bacterium]
ARRLIAENLAHCRIESGCAIIRPGFDELGHDQPDSLGPFHPRDPRDPIPQPFDIILLDPPYDDRVEPTLEKVAAVLAADGVLVLEHAKRREPPAAIDGLARVRQIASGDSALTLFERAAASRPSPD